MQRRADFLKQVEDERLRQLSLPGSEFDVRNSPNDWIAIATHYLSDEVRRGGSVPASSDLEKALVKAAAVILAAYEHVDRMADHGSLLK